MHVLIVGISYSGKTNFAKRLAAEQASVIVFDPLKSSGWPQHAQKYSDPEHFLKVMETAQSAHVFVDESKLLWDANPKEADRLLYNRRHQGLLIYLIAQRTNMIPPNGRNMCSRVFAFKQNKFDADILALEKTPEFKKLPFLDSGHFIGSNGFETSHYKLDYSNGKPPAIVKQ